MSGLLSRVLRPRWHHEGAPCGQRRCTGTLHMITAAPSAHPGYEGQVVRWLAPDDYADAEAYQQIEHVHLPIAMTVGQWRCSDCSRRGLIHREDLQAGRPVAVTGGAA
jgi:hypothetical protein